MSKYYTVYQENDLGEIEKIETVDGVVVQEEAPDPKDAFNNVWRFFNFQSAGERKPYNDNGREYNPDSGNWEWTPEAGLYENPCACNYEAPQDYQGSVPIWDGYNGE